MNSIESTPYGIPPSHEPNEPNEPNEPTMGFNRHFSHLFLSDETCSTVVLVPCSRRVLPPLMRILPADLAVNGQ